MGSGSTDFLPFPVWWYQTVTEPWTLLYRKYGFKRSKDTFIKATSPLMLVSATGGSNRCATMVVVVAGATFVHCFSLRLDYYSGL